MENNIFEKLRNYLNTASQEQLDADWEKFKYWNEIGPVLYIPENKIQLKFDFLYKPKKLKNNFKYELKDCYTIYNNEELYKAI